MSYSYIYGEYYYFVLYIFIGILDEPHMWKMEMQFVEKFAEGEV